LSLLRLTKLTSKHRYFGSCVVEIPFKTSGYSLQQRHSRVAADSGILQRLNSAG
jgi:hypothetical protein